MSVIPEKQAFSCWLRKEKGHLEREEPKPKKKKVKLNQVKLKCLQQQSLVPFPTPQQQQQINKMSWKQGQTEQMLCLRFLLASVVLKRQCLIFMFSPTLFTSFFPFSLFLIHCSQDTSHVFSSQVSDSYSLFFPKSLLYFFLVLTTCSVISSHSWHLIGSQVSLWCPSRHFEGVRWNQYS